MGLDTTHNAWHGSYSTFARFREKVAAAIGINLSEMDGFGGTVKWESLPPDDLHLFLNHSDCDGSLSPRECALIALRLVQIGPKLSSDGPFSDRKSAKQFANGCWQAAQRNETLEFH